MSGQRKNDSGTKVTAITENGTMRSAKPIIRQPAGVCGVTQKLNIIPTVGFKLLCANIAKLNISQIRSSRLMSVDTVI